MLYISFIFLYIVLVIIKISVTFDISNACVIIIHSSKNYFINLSTWAQMLRLVAFIMTLANCSSITFLILFTLLNSFYTSSSYISLAINKTLNSKLMVADLRQSSLSLSFIFYTWFNNCCCFLDISSLLSSHLRLSLKTSICRGFGSGSTISLN